MLLPRFCLLLLLFLPLSQSDDCVFGSGNVTDGRQTVTIAAILPKTNTEYPWSWLRVAPALYQAISRVNCDPWLLPGLKLRLVNGNSENTDGYCSDSMAPLVAVDLKLAHDPWAFIGPGCEFSSSPVARFTTHWDVPMVTAGARATGFKLYAAVTNTGPTHAKLGEFSLKIQQAFDWLRHVMLVYTDNNKDSNNDRPYYFTVEGVYEMLRVQNITAYDYSLETDINYKLAVQKIRDNGRVVYVCCPRDIFRNLMVQFWKDGVDMEDFVFLFIDLFAEGLSGGRNDLQRPWYRGDQDDHAAKMAFRSVKVLTYMEPRNQEYFKFVEDLKRDAKESFNFTIEDSLYNLIAADFYDGVMLYAQALNETLSQQASGPGPIQRPKGDLVTRRMWNRSFSGVSGEVKMDEVGDRETDFAVWDMTDPESGEFQVVSVYNGSSKSLELKDIQWPGGKIPVDMPECGFRNDHPTCLSRTVTMHQMVAIVICFVFIIIVTITVFIYREVTARPRVRGWRINRVGMKLRVFVFQDLMESDGITLDWMFRYSLITDIVKGMAFLHNSVIVSHGNLKSSNCVVDSRFVLKITDYGLQSLRTSSCPENTHAFYARKLWTAPELLRKECPPCGTQRGDVYSFGVILQEVALLKGVFYLDSHSLSPKEIIQAVIRGGVPPLRPSLCFHSHSEELGVLMQRCWSEEPTERPDFNTIKILLRKQHRGYGSNILDNLLSRMEQYANNLEELVEERTQAYHEEKRKAEALLYQILPHSVADQLKRGETVQAEAFDSVTIYFSDIVGFTALSAESTPLQVVTLLNDLYTCFDAIIDNFDVYKVETIGDAYMVVSGLPVRNGKRHGREVARMSLALLDAVKSFKIRHRPDQQLRLRIGIHSGTVCAGVVGLKMPRYCLFGDTVNTASRMESTGEALKIHVSEATRQVLQEFGSFQLQLRGEIEVKGKGRMRTYWLLGENEKN
ncbi:atrial natriuretic peptide receptor 1-like [Gambusia affinis]|uniref:atrial natriuretic peptide receptor 1-like n=1 Tax=Gambusia affinis TaxID=33528 RepID=UPI001CDB9125|nr:atrial natriuretic peptide receptor 1-like [Gambusia affinis]